MHAPVGGNHYFFTLSTTTTAAAAATTAEPTSLCFLSSSSSFSPSIYCSRLSDFEQFLKSFDYTDYVKQLRAVRDRKAATYMAAAHQMHDRLENSRDGGALVRCARHWRSRNQDLLDAESAAQDYRRQQYGNSDEISDHGCSPFKTGNLRDFPPMTLVPNDD